MIIKISVFISYTYMIHFTMFVLNKGLVGTTDSIREKKLPYHKSYMPKVVRLYK